MLKKTTKAIQLELVEYCRMNNDGNIAGTRQDRLHNYRRLIYTIYWEALADAYPIAKSILKEEDWNSLVDDFISNNSCQEPQLFRMPLALIDFVAKNNYSEKLNLPYLIDLLRFEWVEIEVHAMKDVPEELFNITGDLSSGKCVINPYLRIVKLEYPIHKLKTDDITLLKGSYFLLVYRQDNGTVQYLELNAFTANLIEQLCQNSLEMTLQEIIDVIFLNVSPELKQTIYKEMEKFCTSLHELGVILGTKN